MFNEDNFLPEDKPSKDFYSQYWFDGSEEPDYDLIRKYLKQKHEARKLSEAEDAQWSEVLKAPIRNLYNEVNKFSFKNGNHGDALKANFLFNHQSVPAEEMVSMDDFITMMAG